MTLWEFNNYDKRALALNIIFDLQQEILKSKHKNNNKTIKHFEELGYCVKNCRVEFNGGVGTFKWYSRKHCYRIQLCAAIQGYDTKYTKLFKSKTNIILRSKKSKHRYFKYAYCIEIYPESLQM